VAQIPRGRVATYGQLSKLLAGRLTPVGIGWALAACTDELPWHRVVNAKGGLSTEGKNPGLQRDLLESEGIPFNADGTIDLARCQWSRGAGTGGAPRARARASRRV
jgi:methylated-DNA-protein-cysteine methyltransferase-like protein